MGRSRRAQAVASLKRSSRQIIPATPSPTNSPNSTRSMNPLATHRAKKGDDNSPIPDINVEKSDETTEYVLQHVPSRKRRKVVTVVSSTTIQALSAQPRYIEVIPEQKTKFVWKAELVDKIKRSGIKSTTVDGAFNKLLKSINKKLGKQKATLCTVKQLQYKIDNLNAQERRALQMQSYEIPERQEPALCERCQKFPNAHNASTEIPQSNTSLASISEQINEIRREFNFYKTKYEQEVAQRRALQAELQHYRQGPSPTPSLETSTKHKLDLDENINGPFGDFSFEHSPSESESESEYSTKGQRSGYFSVQGTPSSKSTPWVHEGNESAMEIEKSDQEQSVMKMEDDD